MSNIYIVNQHSNKTNIYKLYKKTKKLISTNLNITKPGGIEFDKYNNLYIINQEPALIVKLDTNNEIFLLGKFPSNSNLQNIKIDRSNNIYTTDTSNDAIYKINENITTINKTPIDHPFDLVLDESSNNSIYVTNKTNILYKIDVNGHVSKYFLEKDASYTGILINRNYLYIADSSSIHSHKIIKVPLNSIKEENIKNFTKHLKNPTYMTISNYIYVSCKSKKIVKIDRFGHRSTFNNNLSNSAGIACLKY